MIPLLVAVVVAAGTGWYCGGRTEGWAASPVAALLGVLAGGVALLAFPVLTGW